MVLESVIRRFSGRRILVVGDLMVDTFVWGDVDRISPEAPVPVVRVARETTHLGGAGNVVNNLRVLGAEVWVAGAVADDSPGRWLLREIRAIGAHAAAVATIKGSVTTRKTRVLARGQQVVRVDREVLGLAPSANRRIASFLRRRAADFDAVVLSDYGKGVLNPDTLAAIAAGRGATPVVLDPKRANYDNYLGITLAKPNAREAAEATGIEIADDASAQRAGEMLRRRWQAEAVLITRGQNGMSLIDRSGSHHFHSAARQVYDVTGAGDTVAAVAALALASGATAAQAAQLANDAAGVVVGKLGTATVTRDELKNAVRLGGQARRSPRR